MCMSMHAHVRRLSDDTLTTCQLAVTAATLPGAEAGRCFRKPEGEVSET